MTFPAKLAIVVGGIVAALLIPYFLWHRQMDAYFSSEGYRQWLISVRPYAWFIRIGLIVADLFLPIPVPPVMATLGAIYGTLVGGIVATVGSVLAGLVAYALARIAGRKAIRLLASERDVAALQDFFDTWGGGAIIASRALPVVPEVVTVLAGLARMHLGRFVISLILGSIPVGIFLAWAGHAAGQSSWLLLVLTLIPLALWFLYSVIASCVRKAPQDPDRADVTGEAVEVTSPEVAAPPKDSL